MISKKELFTLAKKVGSKEDGRVLDNFCELSLEEILTLNPKLQEGGSVLENEKLLITFYQNLMIPVMESVKDGIYDKEGTSKPGNINDLTDELIKEIPNEKRDCRFISKHIKKLLTSPNPKFKHEKVKKLRLFWDYLMREELQI